MDVKIMERNLEEELKMAQIRHYEHKTAAIR